MKTGTGTILIVEDEDHDVEFLRRAFERVGVNNPIQRVANGEAATDYLAGRGVFADRGQFPFPAVIITDVKMPQMGGIELLRWISENADYRVVPTIVLTSSMSDVDVLDAYRHGASGYFVKPVRFAELEAIAKAIADYWNRAVTPVRRN
jgi:CheY-like chemotaxis protein